MGFKLKSKGELLGINEELSSYSHPVFEKDLGPNVIAEANRDGTTYVHKDAPEAKKREAIAHENVHHEQMQQGRLQYTDETVTWKKDTRSPSRVYRRLNGHLKSMDGHENDVEGGNFQWEKEAYKKQNNHGK